MPIASVKLKPGVVVDATPTLNESGVSQANLIRYKDGLVQKYGGWQKFYPNSIGSIPRDLHAWSDLNQINHLSFGATSGLAVITSGNLQVITPQQFTSNITLPAFSTTNTTPTVGVNDPNIANLTTFDSVFFNTPVSVGGIILNGIYPITTITGANSYNITAQSNATSTVASGGAVPGFTTTNTSQLVTVNLPSHGLTAGQQFTFPIPTTGNGVTISGTYTINSITDANNFVISVNVQASASGSFSMNGGQAQLLYYISIGPLSAGAGFGLGGFGLGGFGTGVTPGQATGTAITATDWTEDNWGEILLACPRGGGIYFWSPSGGFQTASLINTGPVFNNGIFVAMPQQILVAWGSQASVAQQAYGSGQGQDPLIVRWSDVLNFNQWTPSAATQAGSYHIPTGSAIRGGMQGPQQGLIWTDIDLWAMSYLGAPLVFGFNKVASGCGLVGSHAAAILRGEVYWMGLDNFYMYGGSGVVPIPCPIWDIVFQDLDTANIAKVRAAPNSSFSEMAWFYPSISGGTGECDKYVKVNVAENYAWDYGVLGRSAWIDQSVFGQPIGASPQGLIYQHETTNDADGQPMDSFFQTGAFMLSEGDSVAFVDWLFPDFKWTQTGQTNSANLAITLYSQYYPNDTPTQVGPSTVNSATTFISPRIRGRQLALRVEGTDLGSWYRLGNVRFRVAPDGRQ